MQPTYQTVEERKKELGGIYQPMYENINKQIAALPEQYAGQKSSLEQAKENAFRDITKGAARGGMFFTGFTPREQARYLGEKYLPGLQNLTAEENQARLSLLGQMANLQSQEKAGALSYLDQLTNWQRADAETAAAAKASGSGGGGFSGFDFEFPTDTGTTTGGQMTAAEIQDRNAKLVLDSANNLINTGDKNIIKARVDMLRNQVSRTTGINKQIAQLELDALERYGKEKGIDIYNIKTGASRAQQFYNRPLVGGVSINRATLTPGEALNTARTSISGLRQGFNWIFGAR